MLRGVDPAREPRVSTVDRAIVDGSFEALQPGSDRVVLGRILAFQLGATLGDEITVMIPAGGTADVLPRILSEKLRDRFPGGVVVENRAGANGMIASDATAIAPYTRQVIYLNEQDVVTLSAGEFKVVNLGAEPSAVNICKLDYEAEAAERATFRLRKLLVHARSRRVKLPVSVAPVSVRVRA
jgi:hypothetical protein